MAVSKRTRFEVLRRDNYTCRYCRSTDGALTVDHVTPVALGGTDDPTNLVAACKDCNAGKSSSAPDSTLVADVAEDAVRWSKAMKVAARARSRQRKRRDDYVAEFEDAWGQWWCAGSREPLPRPAGWLATIWKFYEVGLPIENLRDAVAIAGGNDRVAIDQTFRYMCGIARKMLTELQDAAREVVAADGA